MLTVKLTTPTGNAYILEASKVNYVPAAASPSGTNKLTIIRDGADDQELSPMATDTKVSVQNANGITIAEF